MVASKLATLTELGTTLGAEDLYDLLEVNFVMQANRWIASQPKG